MLREGRRKRSPHTHRHERCVQVLGSLQAVDDSDRLLCRVQHGQVFNFPVSHQAADVDAARCARILLDADPHQALDGFHVQRNALERNVSDSRARSANDVGFGE